MLWLPVFSSFVILIVLPFYETKLILKFAGDLFDQVIWGIYLCVLLIWIHAALLATIIRAIMRRANYLNREYTQAEVKELREEAKKFGYVNRRMDCAISTVRPVINIQTAKPDTNFKNNPTLNLDDVARRCGLKLLYKECLYLMEHPLKCEVDWVELTFEHRVTKFFPKVKDGNVIATPRGEIQTGTKWVKLLSSYFNNESEFKQTCHFRGSRDTTTWVDVDLEQYYTVNKQVCIEVKLPQIPHFPMDKVITLSLNKLKGRVFEEIQMRQVNMQVEVEPSSRAHAQLLARQECSVFEFEIRTTLSSPKGNVHVKFPLEAIMYALGIKDLHKGFQLFEDGGVLKPEEKACVELVEEKWLDKDGVERSTTYPQIITRGTCVCLSWTDQKVDIKTSPLSMDESTCDGDHNMNKTPVCYTEEDPGVDSFVVVD
ncbi:uncharacterized protein LOC131952932 [Physella acuta]|uniref:uncharacterized protein LOC131952932 n=1 Tax=Physella acuta TaxID=109671 RepID=UPI0027DD86FA|nr:uncharacterized protein LOC131952932 [Physella acuta]